MRCPNCGSLEDRVVDSRSSREGREIRRRRECLACGKRFTTYEYVEDASFTVIKSDGRREAFNRQKLLNGIRLACTKRPVSIARIEAMVDDIESEVVGLQEREVDAKQIGELVMDRLRKLDEVAYVRFASVYRAFKDKKEFVEELSKLLSNE
ncbi:MAG: transcriptional regulator NrdR [Candidatus Latescibacterota bacterium]|nr:transcriptional repressor NrdR [Candidatus Latescibacterota bacterium]RKY69970.1 MAG: transcriptional regulator NrdR [Candidatus Latescibacterota bacterium]